MCTENTLLAYVGNIGWRSKYLRSCNYSADYNLSAKQVLGISPLPPVGLLLQLSLKKMIGMSYNLPSAVYWLFLKILLSGGQNLFRIS